VLLRSRLPSALSATTILAHGPVGSQTICRPNHSCTTYSCRTCTTYSCSFCNCCDSGERTNDCGVVIRGFVHAAVFNPRNGGLQPSLLAVVGMNSRRLRATSTFPHKDRSEEVRLRSDCGNPVVTHARVPLALNLTLGLGSIFSNPKSLRTPTCKLLTHWFR
jgi:hypothetical protein